MVGNIFVLLLILGTSSAKESTNQAKNISNGNLKSLVEHSDAINKIAREITHPKKSNNFPKARQLSGTCTDGAANCQTCASLSLCGTCDTTGYLPDFSGGCTQSSLSHCDVVYDQDNCNICSAGYYSECTRCSSFLANCKECESPSECISCLDGYYLNSAGNCVTCPGTGVATCYDDGSMYECKVGYYDNGSNKCISCPSKYPNCIACDSFGCSKCNSEYLPDDDGKCVKPNASVTNCLILASGSTTECYQCIDGYYESSGSCLKAPSCTSTQYWDYNNNVCSECTNLLDNCQTCDSEMCYKCAQGYILDSSIACSVSSAANCDVVDYIDTSKCVYCSSGYILDEALGVCYQSNLKNCLDASDSFTCRNCFDDSTEACVACGSTPIQGCDCPSSDNSYCAKCKTGWIQSGSGCAIVCPSNCLQCSDPKVCAQCKPGYFLYDDNNGGTSCISCTDSCSSCNPTPECFKCADLVVQDGSSCRIDKVGYQLSFDSPNIVIDFAHSLSKSAAIENLAAKDSDGNTLSTASWSLASSTVNQIQIKTDLTESLLPIDIQFSFLQSS